MIDAGIEDWFINSCEKIKYMFPKAHAAAYVMSAFRIAWYKVHMPVYFYASWFSTKATAFDIETMINGYDAIKEKIIDVRSLKKIVLLDDSWSFKDKFCKVFCVQNSLLTA